MTTISVTTNNATGYSLTASDASDINSGPPCAGVGSKDTAKWGTGISGTDYVANRYAALRTTAGTLHDRATYSAATDTVTVGYRANFSVAELAGSYATTVIYSAVANP